MAGQFLVFPGEAIVKEDDIIAVEPALIPGFESVIHTTGKHDVYVTAKIDEIAALIKRANGQRELSVPDED